jgi:peptidoglycan/xylan/chitin deacetylase (PgdA/CDA1 family)
MRAVWRFHRARQWLRCRFKPPAVILMYHRVAALPGDPFLLAVSPGRFAEHLAVIRQIGTPIHLDALVAGIRRGTLPRRAVVLTFDDGYADNLHEARPLLERHDVPATVFVTAGQVGSDREFWWDELDRLILQPGPLPSALSLDLNGRRFEWRLDEAGTSASEFYRVDPTWHVERAEDPSPRYGLFRALFRQLYGMAADRRTAVLNQLARWAGRPLEARLTHRALTSDELRRLADGSLVEIGAHTVTHPVLAALPPSEQGREVRDSRRQLASMLQRPISAFAYPHGSVTPEAARVLTDAGFTSACSSEVDTVFASSDPMRLPRVGVRDWDGDTMGRHLRWWLGL